MSQNYNHRNLEHAINIRRFPERAAALQKAFDEKRLARIEKAISTRPVYIPFKFTLDAAGQVSPYQKETPTLPYDVIITGIITNNSARRIALREPNSILPIAIVGEKRNLYLSLADIAGGTSQAEKGQKGIFTLPSPLTIDARSRLYVDVYKPDTTDAPETINFVLTGYRVLKNQTLDGDVRASVERAIGLRSMPKTIFLIQEITFDSDNIGGRARNVSTPPVEEPILIRGVRSSLRSSFVNLGIQGETQWTTDDTPIWAIAAEDDDESDSYVYFQRSIFLPRDGVIEQDFINSVDGVNLDPQTGGKTWICETM